MAEEPKRRLGRGLDALFGGQSHREPEPRIIPVAAPVVAASSAATSSAAPGQELPSNNPLPSDRLLAITAIQRNPFQPRRDFDAAGLAELADSIRQHGVLQPVLVRPVEGGFQLIAGERRWLAARQAGLTAVPCRIMSLEDRAVSEAALEENLKRRDLNPLEKAQAFQDYVARNGCTIEELGKRLSLDRSTVSNMLRLLELPERIQSLIRQDKLSAGHAKAILPLEEPAQQTLCERILAEGLSVRKTEEAVRELLRADRPDVIPLPGSTKDRSAKPDNDPAGKAVEKTAHVLSLEQQFRDLLGLKVEIRLKTKESGQLVVEFSNNNDFERLTKFLRRAA